MTGIDAFETLDGDPVAASFLRDGYVVLASENRQGLDRIEAFVRRTVCRELGLAPGGEPERVLDTVHERVGPDRLNALRLAVIQALRGEPWFRPTYYAQARNALHSIVGNELAMQRGIGLNIQLPGDDSSLLPVHADVWDGDSPFEVVLWVPLVDCRGTKSMYVLPLARDRAHQSVLRQHQHGGAEALFQAIAADALFLEIPYGSVLLFSPTLMHGNRVNAEAETRWSMNCRFKSLMSPYADKRLGEFFDPICLRPATQLGLAYRTPDGFDE